MSAPQRPQPRRYLRKRDVRNRYNWRSDISVDRAVKRGDLPEPDLRLGSAPLWLEQTLDAHDDAQRKVPA